MSPTRPVFTRTCLTLALALGLCACAPHEPLPRTDAPSVDARLVDLERRVERIEARPEIEQPYRNKEEIQANIEQLQAERQKLLTSYTAQHPAIKDIDRRLMILNAQLKMEE